MREEMEHASMLIEWIRRNNGDFAGHIETYLFSKGSILAVEKGDDLVVSEYHVGTYGLFERLSVYHFGVGLLRFLGARAHVKDPKRIPWQELDLSDPEKPVWQSSQPKQ